MIKLRAKINCKSLSVWKRRAEAMNYYKKENGNLKRFCVKIIYNQLPTISINMLVPGESNCCTISTVYCINAL